MVCFFGQALGSVWLILLALERIQLELICCCKICVHVFV